MRRSKLVVFDSWLLLATILSDRRDGRMSLSVKLSANSLIRCLTLGCVVWQMVEMPLVALREGGMLPPREKGETRPP